MKKLQLTQKINSSKYLVLALCIGIFSITKTFAATYFSIASTNWGTTSTWSLTSGGSASAAVPGAGDNVVIERGFNVLVNSNQSITNITVGTANGAGTLTITGAAVSLSTSGVVSIGLAGSTITGTGTLALTNTGNMSVSGSSAYSVTVSSKISLVNVATPVNIASTYTAVVTGVVSGAGGISLNPTTTNTGRLQIGSATSNTYSGGTILNAGELDWATGSQTKTAIGTGTLTIDGGTILGNYSGGAVVYPGPINQVWNGSFTIVTLSNNAFTIGDGTASSTITLGGDVTLDATGATSPSQLKTVTFSVSAVNGGKTHSLSVQTSAAGTKPVVFSSGSLPLAITLNNLTVGSNTNVTQFTVSGASPGATITLGDPTVAGTGNLTINNAGSAFNQTTGNITLSGNLSNNSSVGSNTFGNTNIVFNSSSQQQTIGGTVAMPTPGINMTIQNTYTAVPQVSLGISEPCNGITLTSGLLELNGFNLTLSVGTPISGSSSSYIATDGSGSLIQTYSGTGTYTYPVGDDANASDYTPISFNYTAGAGTGTISVNTSNSKYTNNKSAVNFLNRYWNISSTVTGSSTFTATGSYLFGSPTDIPTLATEADIATGFWTGTWANDGAVSSHQVNATATFTGTTSAVITGIDNSSPSVTSVTQACNLLTANASGAQIPLTYSWSGGNTNSSFNPNPTTNANYTVTVTDANGFQGSSTVAYTGLIGSISSTNIVCGGTGFGTGTITASGGSAPLTYTWQNGETTSAVTDLAVGTYTCSVADNSGCTVTGSVTIVNNGLSVTFSSLIGADCAGQGGSATANVTGSVSTPFTYTWNGGPSSLSSTGTNLPAGTNTVVVQDNGGCSTTATVAITQIPALTVSVSGAATFQVIHYWDFNSTLPTSGGGKDSLGTAYSYAHTFSQDNSISTYQLNTDYSAISTKGHIVYSQPSGDGILDNLAETPFWAYINDLNNSVDGIPAIQTALGNDSAGTQAGNIGVRARNPSTNAFMYLYLPTTGYENVRLHYALSASSSSGANYNVYSYSTNGGTTWNNLTAAMDTFATVGGYPANSCLNVMDANTEAAKWDDIKVNFASDPAVNNNPNFVVRWQYEGPQSGGGSGNDRYDNISLDGNLIGEPCSNSVSYTANSTVANGVAPYTYAWTPSGGNSSTATLSAGTYTLTVQDNRGCSNSASITVTAPAALSATTAVTPASACGNTGTATATPSNGTSPYYYSWAPSGGTNATASNLSATTYSVTVTDANGCTTSATATVTAPAALTVPAPTFTSVTCSSPGAANAAPTGGTTPYTYLWTLGGQTNATATGLAGGTYTITVHDANNCSASATVTITAPSSTPVVSITSSLNQECNLGTATASGTGGTAPYTFTWTPSGGNAPTASGLTAATYTVTMQDNTGCSSSTTTTISSVTAVSASAAGFGPYAVIHYWDFNNTPPLGGGAGDSLGNSANPLPPDYSVLIGSGAQIAFSRPSAKQPSCATRDSILDNGAGGAWFNDLGNNIDGDPAVVSILGNDSTNGNNYVRARNPTENAYMYVYMPSTGYSNLTMAYAVQTTAAGAQSNTIQYTTDGTTWNNLTAPMDTFSVNSYTMTYTASSVWYPVHIHFASDPATNNNPNFAVRWTFGAGSTGGSGNDRYDNFSLSGNLINSGCANNYTVSTTAAHGQTPYSYSWSGGLGTNATASNVAPGTYTCTVTDGLSCTTAATITIAGPGTLTPSITTYTNVTCNGGNDGAANATVSGGVGPYLYSWAPNGETTQNISSLTANTYTITVTDYCGTTANTTIAITEPPTLAATATVTANTTACGSIGNANATPSGGTGPYLYVWSNGTSDISFVNPTGAVLPAGNYTVTVTDNCGANATASVTITAPGALTANAGIITNVRCTGGNTGNASASPTGGTLPYTYSWSNGTTVVSTSNPTGTILSAGSYTVTVQDNTGCSATGTVAITEPGVLSTTATTLANIGCSGGNNGNASATPSNGTAPYTYSWSNGTTTVSTANPTGTILSAGSYTVTVKDNCGTSATASVTITQSSVVTVTLTNEVEVRCHGASTGAGTAVGWGGTPPYSYSWNGGPFSTTNATMSGLSAGTYTVTVSDANGCTATHTLTLKQPSPLRDSIVTSKTLNVKCLGVNYGTAQLGAKLGTAPYTYLWSNSLTNAEVTTLSAGTYTVSVTDNCGASGSTTVTITAPAAALSQTTTVNKNVTCFGGNDGGATANPSGGTIPYTYLWNTGQTNQTITNFIAGNHQSTLKDAHGCSVITPTIITQPAVISASFTTTKSCFGSSTGTATATGKGGSGSYTTYIWSNSDAGPSISALSAGTYSVTVTDSKGCTGTASVAVAPYTQLVTTIPTVTCVGVGGQGKLTVSSTGGTPAYKYRWSTGATTTTITVVNGSYTAVCTDKNLCTASASQSFSACPEIKPKNDDGDNDGTSVENNVSVYPNPTNGQFTIAGLENGMIVEMYDYTGRKITTVSASDKTMQLNIANQANGIYLIRILDKSGNLIGQKKVVKTN